MDSQAPENFAIKDCALLTIATGRRIYTLGELRDSLAGISTDSIYHHFWGGLLQPRFEEREYNNDFAAWVRHGLHDGALAERLAVVDPREYADLEELRQELVELVDERLDEEEFLHWVRATRGFEFMRAQIVVFATDKFLRTPSELRDLLPTLPISSIFYHFIDAHRRTASHADDFSLWLEHFGEEGQRLRKQLACIDPYFVSLTETRDQLIEVFAPETEVQDASR